MYIYVPSCDGILRIMLSEFGKLSEAPCFFIALYFGIIWNKKMNGPDNLSLLSFAFAGVFVVNCEFLIKLKLNDGRG